MNQVDFFGEYVRDRLEGWGREFALHRDCEYLGHQSKNMLQVLIEHRGEMPARPTGFKPLEVDARAHEIELIVSVMAMHDKTRACCLRAFYCGTGRRGVERLETAQRLVTAATGREIPMRRGAYYAAVDLATSEVRGALIGKSLAAA